MGTHRTEAPTASLGTAMSRVARELQEQHGDVEATLHAISAAAVSAVPQADACSISYVIGRSRIEPRAWTSDLARSVDQLQTDVGQGPCVDAIWDSEVVQVDDVASEERWPEFARRVAGLGVGSMLSFQLFVQADHLGALNLYAASPRAFDEESREIGLLVAGHAAVALAGAEHEQNLRAGMSSRDLIGQAKGILMERYKLSPDQAFGVLARVSQELNRKVGDIARELSETGVVPRREV